MYHVLQSNTPPDIHELNELYANGWQLISIVAFHDWFFSYFISIK